MIKIFNIFDVHVSDQSPGFRTETYTQDILTKLEETVRLSKKHEATHILFLGDIFDQKVPNRVSHRLVQQVADIMRSYGKPVYILVGNHDISGGTLDSLPKQPIGILAHLPNVQLLTWDKLVLDEDVAIYPVPGVPILHESWQDRYVTEDKRKRVIIAAHQLIARDVTQYPEAARHAFQPAQEVAKHTDASFIVSGDLHTPQGVYVLPRGKGGHVGFANLGSLCRLSVKDVDHEPKCLLLTINDDEKRSLQTDIIPLESVRPASEVFRLEEQAEAKSHKADIDETISKIKTTRIHKFSLDAVIEDINTNTSVDQTTREVAVDLLEAVK